MSDLSKYYSVKAAADEIGMNVMALYQRIHRNKVQVEKTQGNVTLVPLAEVKRLKAERDAA